MLRRKQKYYTGTSMLNTITKCLYLKNVSSTGKRHNVITKIQQSVSSYGGGYKKGSRDSFNSVLSPRQTYRPVRVLFEFSKTFLINNKDLFNIYIIRDNKKKLKSKTENSLNFVTLCRDTLLYYTTIPILRRRRRRRRRRLSRPTIIKELGTSLQEMAEKVFVGIPLTKIQQSVETQCYNIMSLLQKQVIKNEVDSA